MKTILWWIVYILMITAGCWVAYVFGEKFSTFAIKVANAIVPGTIFDDRD